MKKLFLKITIITFIAGVLFPVFPVKQSSAQFTIEFGPGATTLVNAIIAATTETAVATTATAIGVGDGISASTTISGIRTALSSGCQATISGYDSATAVEVVADTTSSTALSVIGGGPAELTNVSAKLAAATAAKACVDVYVTALSAAPTATVLIGAELSREQDKFTKVSNSLRQSIQDLSARQNATAKDILKALMIKVVLNVSKNLTTEMVNKMVEKYKISDYLAYGDAVATQVYSMKYINENFAGDARQQMMIRSLLQSEKFPDKIKTVQSFANSKAQEYLGTACNVANPGISSNDQNYFLKCLAAYGAPQSDPQYHYLVAADQAQATKAAANTSTQAELSQSAGFAPPRNCDGSLAMQQQIDTQYDTTFREKDIAVATAARLKAALAKGQTTQAEYDRAQAAADQAIANANALGEKSDSPIIDICKAIDSPAQFVSSSINSYLAKHFDESSQLKSENLPFYASFLADVASNFLTNILTGGKSTSQVLKEAGVGALNGAIIGVTQGGNQGQTPGTGPTNPVGNVDIYAQANGVTLGTRTTALVAGQAYIITLDFSEISDERINRVVINGVGVDGGSRNLSLSPADVTRGNIQFDYTADNAPMTLRATFYAPPLPGDAGDIPVGVYTQVFSVAQVGGAVTTVSAGFAPRGPMPQFR